MKPRTILTPVEDAVLSSGGGRSFWKRVLPDTEFDYKDQSGKTRRLDFGRMIPSLLKSFDPARRVPFVLADADNRHTMDPERERGTVTKMVRWEDLPPKVQAEIVAKEGAPRPGLYSKIRFPNEQLASAVLNSEGKLGVSARIREDDDGGPRVIHVLGTSDPKITNLGDWSEDADLSGYASEDVIDLSNASYPEDTVGQKRRKTIDLATLTDADIEAGKVTEDDIAEMTDEEIAAFVERFEHLLPEDTEPDGENDDDDDEPDDEEDNTPEETTLSREAQAQIDLANAKAERAIQRADEATRRTVEREWKTRRAHLVSLGIPPEKIDLCEPYLKRPDSLVVDLSTTDFGGDDASEVGEVIETLLMGYSGTIDMGHEYGHYGNGMPDSDGGDIDAELDRQFDAAFPQYARQSD